MLIPHHTGRKRFHLELRENISKYGAELKNSVIRNMKGVMQGIQSLIYSQDQRNEATTDDDTDAAVQAATQEILSTQNDISRNESTDNLKGKATLPLFAYPLPWKTTKRYEICMQYLVNFLYKEFCSC